MSFDRVPAGKNLPDEVNVIIEIPMGGEPIKYEIDKETDAIFVDRILGTSMRYPCNYGYVPQTLCDDGDAADVLVIMNNPLLPGSVVKCRPVGVLKMTDESGVDAKVIAVPVSKITPLFDNIEDVTDVAELTLKQISHFFEHYKDLESGKWVKVDGWEGVEAAKQELRDAVKAYEEDVK